ncbi:hypothetical protein COY95_00535, partial [Candidatus Woesearchaeota archaeon CG_4_10_14_0_8_um_filter_47_5]
MRPNPAAALPQREALPARIFLPLKTLRALSKAKVPVRMPVVLFCIFFSFIWAVPLLHASGSVSTGALAPASLELCGPYAGRQTVSAITLYNKENFSLVNLTATLVVPRQASVSFATPSSVTVGTIPSHNYSLIIPSWTITCNNSVPGTFPGTYTLYVNYTSYTSPNRNIATSLNEATAALIIGSAAPTPDPAPDPAPDTAPPVVIAVAPQGTVFSSSVQLLVTTDENATCRYGQQDSVFEALPELLQGTGSVHTRELEPANGTHTFYVRCRDRSNNTMQVPEVITFSVAFSPFQLSHTLDLNNAFSRAVINLTTGRQAFCRYASAARTAYTDMTGTFDHTGGKTHIKTLFSLVSGPYTYYIRCKDLSGITMQSDYVIAFTIDSPPTAQLFVEEDGVLREGTYKVTLSSSEDLIPTPILTYSFDDTSKDQIDIFIPLTGSGKNWYGYIIIDKTDDKRVGAFKFSGTDFSGNTGHTIARGGIFLTDTRTLQKPTNFKATAERDGSIKLSWHSPDDDIDYFKIYRSTSPNVDYLDFYDIWHNASYRDRDTEDQVTYYYKVTAVSTSGNEGLFSSEIAIKAEDLSIGYASSGQGGAGGEKTDSSPGKLAPHLLLRVDSLARTGEELSEKIAGAQTLLGEHELASQIAQTPLGEELVQNKKKIDDLLITLAALKTKPLNDSDLEHELSKVSLQYTILEQSTPRAADLVERTDLEHAVSGEDVQLSLFELLKVMRLDSIGDAEKEDLISRTMRLQDALDLKGEAFLFKVTHLDGSARYLTLVEKHFTVSPEGDAQEDAPFIMENIPKSVATSLDEIYFTNKGYEKIKTDPMVQWETSDLGGEIAYTVTKKVDLGKLSYAKTILIPDLQAALEPAGSASGASSASSLSSGNSSSGFSGDSSSGGPGSPTGYAVFKQPSFIS